MILLLGFPLNARVQVVLAAVCIFTYSAVRALYVVSRGCGRVVEFCIFAGEST